MTTIHPIYRTRHGLDTAVAEVLDVGRSGSGPPSWFMATGRSRSGRRVRGRYLTERGEEQIGTVLARYDDAAIVVSPDRWLAWDMTALYTTLAEEGISLDDADEWFNPVGT